MVQEYITNWVDFTEAFLDKFGEDKTLVSLALELSHIKIDNKERIKDFTKRFLTLKRKIHVACQPPEDIIKKNYASTLPKYLGMFVKQANKDTLFEIFGEAIKAENKYLTYEPERSRKIDTFYHKRTEKSSSYKDKTFDVEKIQKIIRALTNEVVGLKKNSGNLFL